MRTRIALLATLALVVTVLAGGGVAVASHNPSVYLWPGITTGEWTWTNGPHHGGASAIPGGSSLCTPSYSGGGGLVDPSGQYGGWDAAHGWHTNDPDPDGNRCAVDVKFQNPRTPDIYFHPNLSGATLEVTYAGVGCKSSDPDRLVKGNIYYNGQQYGAVAYGHLVNLQVSAGNTYPAGTKLGTVAAGSSSCRTAPHVHYEFIAVPNTYGYGVDYTVNYGVWRVPQYRFVVYYPH